MNDLPVTNLQLDTCWTKILRTLNRDICILQLAVADSITVVISITVVVSIAVVVSTAVPIFKLPLPFQPVPYFFHPVGSLAFESGRIRWYNCVIGYLAVFYD